MVESFKLHTITTLFVLSHFVGCFLIEHRNEKLRYGSLFVAALPILLTLSASIHFNIWLYTVRFKLFHAEFSLKSHDRYNNGACVGEFYRMADVMYLVTTTIKRLIKHFK